MHHSDNLDGTFTNPLIHADYPDPDIIRVGADFYMVSSSFTTVPGVPVCHSRDLVNWRIIGHAYDRLPATNPAYSMLNGQMAYRGGSWAPSIRFHDGKFYICFCTPAEGTFICISDQPQGPYEMIPLGIELYDPGLFFDEDGRVYVAHGANGISITELARDARSVRSDPVSIYETAFGTPLEGSHLYKRGGFYYLCLTSRGYNGIQVCLRSRHLHGPYEARVICGDDMNYAGAGLHQGGFVELASGETWFFLFQDRDWLGRLPVLQPVTWIDDWPMLGDPDNYGKACVTWRKPNLPATIGPTLPHGSDEFDLPRLNLQWQWNHNPDETRFSLSARPGFLRLISAPASELMRARNTLTQKIVGPESTATATLDMSGMRPGDLGGIAIVGFPYALIGVSNGESDRRIVMINDGKEIAAADLSRNNTTIRLRIHADVDGIAHFSYCLEGGAFLPLGDTLTMQFTVKTFLGNRFGLFCFNQRASGGDGHADFDDFQLDAATPANHFTAFKPIASARYDAEHGVDTQRPAEKLPRQYLHNINDGDWICFNHIDFGDGASVFHARVSPLMQGGTIEIRLDELDGPMIGQCVVRGDGNLNSWNFPFHEVSCPITSTSGVHRLYLRFVGPGRYHFRFDDFSFSN